MRADDFLQALTQILYFVLAIAVAVRVRRRRDPAARDAMLLFGATGLASLLLRVQAATGLDLSALVGPLVLTSPYLLLRLLSDFRPLPRWLLPLAGAAFLLLTLLEWSIQGSDARTFALSYATYFVLLAPYVAVGFFRAAHRSRGVTRRRMQAAAGGTGLILLTVLLSVVTSIVPQLGDGVVLLQRLAGLLSSLAFFAAFAPPRALRRAWQEPEISAFLNKVATLAAEPADERIAREVEGGVADALGAAGAALGFWSAARGTLRFYAPGTETAIPGSAAGAAPGYVRGDGFFDLHPGEMVGGRAFQEDRPLQVADVVRDDPKHARYYRALEIETVVAAPLTSGTRRLGVLLAYGQRAPIFAESDLELLQVFANVVAVALDARARVQAREAAYREQMEAILGGMADGVMVQDQHGRITYANDTAARLAGFPDAATYLGATAAEISANMTVLDADGRPFDYQNLSARRALRGEANPSMVVQFRRRDTGEVRWSHTRSRRLTGAEGETLALSLFQDISERVRAEHRLRLLADVGARLPTTLEPDAILAALTGLTTETVADWSVVYMAQPDGSLRCASVAHRDPSLQARLRSLGEAACGGGLDANAPVAHVLRDGSARLVGESSNGLWPVAGVEPGGADLPEGLQVRSLIYAPLRSRDRILGVYGAFTSRRSGQDLTEEDLAMAEELARRVGLALENAELYRQATDAVKARDEFLSVASHELRTPVAGLKAYAQMMQRRLRRDGGEGSGDPSLVEAAFRRVEEQSDRLGALVGQLLDVSRLESGKLSLDCAPTDLRELVERVVEPARLAASERRITIQSSGPISAEVDPVRMEQVLVNLLDNAVKFSPPGSPVDITVESRPGTAEGGHTVLVSVRDHGTGIPVERRAGLFGRFYQAHAEGHLGGMGLGLYISRQIAELHGGSLAAQFPEDGGSRFILAIPQHGVPASARGGHPREHVSSRGSAPASAS